MLERPDHGPGYAYRGGRWMPLLIGAAQGVSLIDIPDPGRDDARHEVRVACREDPLRDILNIRDRATRDQERYTAAEQLRRDTKGAEVYLGPRDLDAVTGFGRGDPMTERRIAAQGRVSNAWEAIRRPDNDQLVASVVRLVVMGFCTLERVESHFNWPYRARIRRGDACVRRAYDLLVIGLDRLALHYGLL